MANANITGFTAVTTFATGDLIYVGRSTDPDGQRDTT